jgi:PAS domain S-box-containing protein
MVEAQNYHRLLQRQIRRFVPGESQAQLGSFFEQISEFYNNAEQERRLLETTLDLNSKELEEANRRLRQQHEAMHNSILNALSIGLFAIDNHGKIIFANDSAHHLFGVNVGLLVGLQLLTFVDDQKIADIVEYGASFGRQEGESTLSDSHNHKIPIHYSAYPIVHDKQISGTVFSFSDITLEQKRQELIDLQQLALESMATMMIIADYKGYIQYANNEFVRVSGYDAHELIGEDSRYIIDPSINDIDIVQACWKAVNAGEIWEGEILAQTKSGNVYFEELSITPLVVRGVVSDFVAVKKDISERIRTQEELKLARDEAIMAMNEAKEANRAKDAFLSNMSHELRTPLNAINGFSQVLIARADTPEKVKVFLQKIYVSGLHLLSLVNTLLDFAKIESGKTELFLSSLGVDEIVNDVEILVSPMLDEKKLRLIKKIDQEILVTADRQLLMQVLINLVGNAIKFSPKDEKILISCRYEENWAVFSVIDHGAGIAPDKIATLFDPFVQVREAQNDSIKGTGLGLSIVKKIVELHGGEVWIKSTQGKGSAFYFSLPKIGITSVD